MNATIIQWTEFKSSHVWRDTVASIEEEIRLLHIDLEDPKATLDEVRFIQGKLFAMRHFLQLPENALIMADIELQEGVDCDRITGVQG